MSQLNSTANQPVGGAVQKPRLNVYTMMLIISFFAIVTAVLLLLFELQRFGTYPWWDTKQATPSESAAGPTSFRTQCDEPTLGDRHAMLNESKNYGLYS